MSDHGAAVRARASKVDAAAGASLPRAPRNTSDHPPASALTIAFAHNTQVTVHKSQPLLRTSIAAAFVLLHALTISYAISTAGQPYEQALAEQAKLDGNATNLTNATSAITLDDVVAGMPVPSPPKVAEAVKPASGGGFGEDDWPVEDDDAPVDASGGSAAGAALANATNTTAEKTERPLPHEWLPSALACALLFIGVTANALFYLGCHWSVGFKARCLFSRVAEPAAGCYLYFIPQKNKGRPALVRLAKLKGSEALSCEYQRQRYEVVRVDELAPAGDERARKALADELDHTDGAVWAARLIRCPTELRHGDYLDHKGLDSEAAIAAQTERYGTNVIAVATPRFVDLYLEQLLSPLVIFQLFTSALWLLDAIGMGFIAFQVAMILLLESTSVFQRQKTLKTSTKCRPAVRPPCPQRRVDQPAHHRAPPG